MERGTLMAATGYLPTPEGQTSRNFADASAFHVLLNAGNI